MELNLFGNNKERSLRRSVANALYERYKERSLRRSVANALYERYKERSLPEVTRVLFTSDPGAHFATQPRERSLSEGKAFFASNTHPKGIRSDSFF